MMAGSRTGTARWCGGFDVQRRAGIGLIGRSMRRSPVFPPAAGAAGLAQSLGFLLGVLFLAWRCSQSLDRASTAEKLVDGGSWCLCEFASHHAASTGGLEKQTRDSAPPRPPVFSHVAAQGVRPGRCARGQGQSPPTLTSVGTRWASKGEGETGRRGDERILASHHPCFFLQPKHGPSRLASRRCHPCWDQAGRKIQR